MEILKPSENSFENNIISGTENVDKFYEVIRNPKTKYFWDLDQILVDSAKSVFDEFNKKNPYKITANVWELDKHGYLTSLVENAGYKDNTNWDADWFKNIPLYRSKRFEYAKSALDIAINISGAHNNYILTSRLPRLERATKLWVSREIPEFDMVNILIRNRDDLRSSVEFKTDTLKENSGDDYYTVLVEDQEQFITGALNSNIANFLAIGIPEGRMSYTTRDDRLLVLGRYPIKEQEVMPLYTLFRNARDRF
jgi:hypothetical protein